MSELMNNEYFQWVITFLVHSAFFCVVFEIASKISPTDLLQELRTPKLLIRTFVVASLIIPLITAGIVKALNIPMLLGGVMLLASITPGSPLALMSTQSKKGNLPLASGIMAFLIFIMPIMIPCWLWIFSHWFGLHHLEVSPITIFIKVASLTLIPLIMGIAVNVLLPKIAKKLSRLLDIYSKAAILIIVAIFIVPSLKTLITFTLIDWTAVIVVMTLSLVVGYASSGSTRSEHISLALSATKCNLTALMVIAHTSYPNIDITNVMFAYIIICWLTSKIWYTLFRRQLSQNGEELI